MRDAGQAATSGAQDEGCARYFCRKCFLLGEMTSSSC